jgi:cyclic pyranopterin phosphate synthase
MVGQAEILDRHTAAFDLTEVPGRGSAPAELWYVDGGPATVGVIASVSAPFCGACDRLRLTADGQLRSCLFARSETDLRGLLRDHSSEDGGDGEGHADRERTDGSRVGGDLDARLEAAFRACLATKRPGHDIDDPAFLQPDRPMSAIGG